METHDIINKLTEKPDISEEEMLRYKDSTYELVSKVGYLIGVPTKFFEIDNSNLQKDIYDELDKNKNARIIRNLCLIRAAIERHYTNINKKMKYEYKTISTISEYKLLGHLGNILADARLSDSKAHRKKNKISLKTHSPTKSK